MEIILKEDVVGLGYKNDIVNVKPGYGRNYLIPKGMGILATASAKKMLAETLRQQAVKLAKIKEKAEEIAGKLSGVSLVIPVKVTTAGVIYGSVNSMHISEALKKLGFDIDRKHIVVKDVKEVGNYSAEVKLHKEVSVAIPFEVVAEAAQASAEEVATAETEAAPEAPVEEVPAAAEEEEQVEETAPVDVPAEATAEEAPKEEEE